MTNKKFWFFAFLQWLIFGFLKVYFFGDQFLGNAGLQQIVYWLLIGVVSAALVRRFGVINYLEAFFIIIVWVLLDLLFDLMFVTAYTGLGIFYKAEYLAGFLFMALAVFIFHKKRHVAIRRGELHEHHH